MPPPLILPQPPLIHTSIQRSQPDEKWLQATCTKKQITELSPASVRQSARAVAESRRRTLAQMVDRQDMKFHSVCWQFQPCPARFERCGGAQAWTRGLVAERLTSALPGTPS